MNTLKIFIMIVLFVIVMALNSCGSKSSGDNSNDTNEVSTEVSQPATVALKTKKDLPKCNDKNANQLVYVIADAVFYTCDGEWVEIEIATSESDVKDLIGGFWHDSSTGLNWYLNDDVTNQQLTLCKVGDTVDPMLVNGSKDQILTVIKNGIFGELNVRVWVEQFVYVYSQAPATEITTSAGERAFTLCVVAD